MARRLLVRLLVAGVVVALTGVLAPPARACACGAMLSNDPRLSVSGENAIVRWDGTREEIVMSMTVTSSRKDAALLLPTPAPATVQLGDASWYEMLARTSAPEPRYVDDWWPDHLIALGGMAGAPPGERPDVAVHGESDVGPYHVASLSARDPKALARWLKANGYRLKPRVAAELGWYVRRNWRYTAVKLRATGDEDELSGALPPLRFRFATGSPVYPMRMSHAITADQSVRLYVLTPHRMAARSGGIPFATSYASRVGRQAGSGSVRGLFADGTTYLTTLDGTATPGAVTGDVRFGRVTDTAYRRTTAVSEPVYILGFAGGPFLVVLGLLVVAVFAVAGFGVVAAQRARRTGRRSVQTGSSAS